MEKEGPIAVGEWQEEVFLYFETRQLGVFEVEVVE